MTKHLRPYPEYKDSGLPWLGQIPEHWEIRKLRSILKEVSTRNRPDLPLLSVVREKGVIVRDITSKNKNHNFIPDDLTNYKVVRKGQFAMNKMKAWQGSYGVSRHDGIVSPAYFIYNIQNVTGLFFHTAIRSKAYIPFFLQGSDGVRIGQWDLSQMRMREIPFFIPPSIEQKVIVKFLDVFDEKVRRYIRNRRKLIAVLNTQKNALINQAVTHGINPNVRLKASRVDWLGNIPEHWMVKKIRFIVDAQGGMTPSKANEGFWGGSIPWVTPKDMKYNEINGSIDHISNAALEQTGIRLISPPAVLIVVRGMILARTIPVGVTNVPVTINQDMKALLPKQEIIPKYLSYLLVGIENNIRMLVEESGHGTRVLRTDLWKNMPVPIPPVEEQEKICDEIEKDTVAINSTIAITQNEIDLVREYRTRLISDVVTGKIDVRHLSPEAADEMLDELDIEEDIEDEEPSNDVEPDEEGADADD